MRQQDSGALSTIRVVIWTKKNSGRDERWDARDILIEMNVIHSGIRNP